MRRLSKLSLITFREYQRMSWLERNAHHAARKQASAGRLPSEPSVEFEQVGQFISHAPCLKDENQRSISTNIQSLDEKTGGIKAGDVWLIAARPGMGIHEFSIDMALHIAGVQKVPVLFTSGHMPPETAAHQFVKMHARSVAKPPADDQAEIPIRWLNRAAVALGSISLYIATDWMLSLNALELAVQKVTRSHSGLLSGVKTVVIIDSLSRLQATTSLSKSEIACTLKRIAKIYDIAFLVTSDVKRGLERRRDKRPRLQDIPGYQKIAPWVDHFLCLYRDNIYNPTSTEVDRLELIGHSTKLKNNYCPGPANKAEVTSWSRGVI